MKFVVNTNYNAAGTTVLNELIRRLKKIENHTVEINNWNDYSNYDIVMFTAADSQIKEVKSKYPKKICGIFDPKLTLPRQIKEAILADFLIVSSLEQKEAFVKYNKNIFIYYMFPGIQEIKKIHSDDKKIIIGYHGNKQHLDAMVDLAYALDKVYEKKNIEFWAVYNIEKLGYWKKNVPQKCPIKHIQWREDSFFKELSNCDIGVVPSVIPVSQLFSRPLKSLFVNREGYSKNDYVLRFKMSNNPGRIYVFSQLHIPVISDFTPSACTLIKDGHSGLLVGGKYGWQKSIEDLVENAEFRKQLSSNLKKSIDYNCSIDINIMNFLKFLKKYE